MDKTDTSRMRFSPYSVSQTLTVPSMEADTATYEPGIHETSLTSFVWDGTETRRRAPETVAYTSGDGIVAHKIISLIACNSDAEPLHLVIYDKHTIFDRQYVDWEMGHKTQESQTCLLHCGSCDTAQSVECKWSDGSSKTLSCALSMQSYISLQSILIDNHQMKILNDIAAQDAYWRCFPHLGSVRKIIIEQLKRCLLICNVEE